TGDPGPGVARRMAAGRGLSRRGEGASPERPATGDREDEGRDVSGRATVTTGRTDPGVAQDSPGRTRAAPRALSLPDRPGLSGWVDTPGGRAAVGLAGRDRQGPVGPRPTSASRAARSPRSRLHRRVADAARTSGRIAGLRVAGGIDGPGHDAGRGG